VAMELSLEHCGVSSLLILLVLCSWLDL